MGEYADYEIDRWISGARWGGGSRRARYRPPSAAELREQQAHHQSRNPSRPQDFPVLDAE